MEAILVPVKRFAEAKARLSQVLAPTMRRRLGLAMLTDVMRAIEDWKLKLVVTDDPDAESLAMEFGCTLVADGGAGLNGAIIRGTRAAIELGTSSLLVLASDLPLVSASELVALFSDSSSDVIIAGSSDGGTNALLRRPPDAIAPSFGEDSARAHEEAARSAGLTLSLHRSSGLEFDIDSPIDLERLASSQEERESVRVAKEAVRFPEGEAPSPP